jgi:hypothetical protein
MLDKDVFHWRNKRLFQGVESDTVQEIRWKAGKFSAQATKKDGRWSLVSPVKAPANAIAVEGLVSTLVYAEATGIYAGTEAGNLRKPEAELEFQAGKDKNKIYLYPSPEHKSDQWVARVEGKSPLYIVEAKPFERFRKPLLEYRELHLFPGRERSSVKAISLSFPRQKKKVELRLDSGLWLASGGDPLRENISQDRIKDMISVLVDGEAKEFLPPSSEAARLLKANPADVEVTLKGGGLPDSKARFLVMERKKALTDGQAPGEVAVYGEDVLASLPIRMEDLYESHNKQVVTETKKESHGHNPSPGH